MRAIQILKAFRAPLCAILCAILSVTLCVPPTAATAQDRPFARMTPGDHHTYVFTSGQPMILLLAERTEDVAIWDLILGEDVNAVPYGAYHYDAEGRVTRFVTAAGDVVQAYEPHNCERVVGLCEYRFTEGGQTYNEQRINGFANGAWSYSVFREQDDAIVLNRVGAITYDANGLVISESWVIAGTGAESGVERMD